MPIYFPHIDGGCTLIISREESQRWALARGIPSPLASRQIRVDFDRWGDVRYLIVDTRDTRFPIAVGEFASLMVDMFRQVRVLDGVYGVKHPAVERMKKYLEGGLQDVDVWGMMYLTDGD